MRAEDIAEMIREQLNGGLSEYDLEMEVRQVDDSTLDILLGGETDSLFYITVTDDYASAHVEFKSYVFDHVAAEDLVKFVSKAMSGDYVVRQGRTMLGRKSNVMTLIVGTNKYEISEEKPMNP